MSHDAWIGWLKKGFKSSCKYKLIGLKNSNKTNPGNENVLCRQRLKNSLVCINLICAWRPTLLFYFQMKCMLIICCSNISLQYASIHFLWDFFTSSKMRYHFTRTVCYSRTYTHSFVFVSSISVFVCVCVCLVSCLTN